MQTLPHAQCACWGVWLALVGDGRGLRWAGARRDWPATSAHKRDLSTPPGIMQQKQVLCSSKQSSFGSKVSVPENSSQVYFCRGPSWPCTLIPSNMHTMSEGPLGWDMVVGGGGREPETWQKDALDHLGVTSFCCLNRSFKSLAVHSNVWISFGEKCFRDKKSRATIETGGSGWLLQKETDAWSLCAGRWSSELFFLYNDEQQGDIPPSLWRCCGRPAPHTRWLRHPRHFCTMTHRSP